MTIAEKIIAHRSGQHIVQAEDRTSVRYTLAVGTETVFSKANNSSQELQHDNIDFNRMVIINGHLISTADAAEGTSIAILDKFSQNAKITKYYQAGKSGNCQTLLSDKGLIKSGDFIISNDPHIATYGALGALATHVSKSDLVNAWNTGEIRLTIPHSIRIQLQGKLSPFTTIKDLSLHILSLLGADEASGLSIEIDGSGLHGLSIEQRFALCNMIVETGAMFVWVKPDEFTKQFLNPTGETESQTEWEPDPDASYTATYKIDLESIVPMAATPHSPFNGVPVRSVDEVNVDQIIIGGCNGGTIEDFRQAAELLRNRKITHGVKLMFFPPSHRVLRELVEEELILFFSEHGIQISPPSCSQCAGHGLSRLGNHQVGLYTTNQNYRGHYGNDSTQVYLTGTLVATASAITGKITDPRDL
jgi:3-isopropylmalate/(R)-2-methylmalate dehydratase large subunit